MELESRGADYERGFRDCRAAMTESQERSGMHLNPSDAAREPMDEGRVAPCPFCGHASATRKHLDGTILHPAFQYECDHCGAVAPWSDQGDELDLWNERASLTLSPQDAQLLLVMLGQSEVSRIRSGAFTGEDFLRLVGSLKALAKADENKLG